MRFSSIPPPLTLNPEAPSPTVVTPGIVCTALITSASPSKAGMDVMVAISISLTDMSISFTFLFSASALIRASSIFTDELVSSMSKVKFSETVSVFLISLYPMNE